MAVLKKNYNELAKKILQKFYYFQCLFHIIIKFNKN